MPNLDLSALTDEELLALTDKIISASERHGKDSQIGTWAEIVDLFSDLSNEMTIRMWPGTR